MKHSFKIGRLEDSERDYFERVNPGYVCTGETLEEKWMESNGMPGGCTYVVFKGVGRRNNWTPYGMCRDCGDHYVIARWSRHDRIDKKTLSIIFDTEDR